MNLIIVTAILLTLIIIAYGTVCHKSIYVSDWVEITSVMAIIILVVVLIVEILLVPIGKYDCCQKIEQFKAVKMTITEQRESASELERVQLTKEILQDNAWLKSKQYQYKSSWIGVYVCEDIMDLEPIN